MNQTPSLDQQYLDFTARTSAVFAQFPQIEPLRYFIFKELLVQRRAFDGVDYVKHWLRPLFHRGCTCGPLNCADVLIWIESRREVIADALLPVYRELVSRGVKVGLASFGGPDNISPSTLHFQFPAHAVPPAWAKDAWEALCEITDGLQHRTIRRSFYYTCAAIQGLLDELARVLDIVKPKVVLAASTQLLGGAALMVASRSRGALTLLLQHGILQPFYTPLLADRTLTWGQSSNETLIRLGVSPQKLIALGSPRHDLMAPSTNGSAKAALLRALSLPEKPTFVFFSNGNDLVRNGKAPLECARWLEQTAARHSNSINIIVRLHPNEDGVLYRNCPHLHITKNSPDLAIVLDGCDWVGSLCSTVLYDALLYKKPVWQFYADGWPELADNWQYGLAVRISSQAELSEMMNHMLVAGINYFVDENLLAQVFANFGRAARAVAGFVEGCLGGQGKGKDILSLKDLSNPVHSR